MKNKNTQIVLVLLSSFIILIGYGHGIGPIVLLSLMWFITPFTDGDIEVFKNFTLIGDYNDVIPSVTILFFIGFLILLSAIFIKHSFGKSWFVYIGIVLMLLGYLFLIIPFDNGLRVLSGVSGIPFALLSVKLILETKKAEV